MRRLMDLFCAIVNLGVGVWALLVGVGSDSLLHTGLALALGTSANYWVDQFNRREER
jgi:hypothetical protein